MVSILASLLNQLLTFRPYYKFSNEDERLFDAKQQEGPLNDSAFWYDIKRMIIEVGNPFYLFIDGLDECKDRNTIIDVLVQLVNDLGAFILVASRDEVDLRIGLQDVSCSLTQRFWNRISLSSSGTKLRGLYVKRSSEQGIRSCLLSLNAS